MLKNKEIAEILKISPASVSLALNNKHGVSEETRRKVIALRNGSVASDYNELQQLSSNASQLLFLVLKKHGGVISDTPFFMQLSETLHQHSAVAGFGLQPFYTSPSEDLRTYLPSINADRYDGILVLGTEATNDDIEEILSLKKPTVVLDAWFDSLKVDCVLMDNEKGIRTAVRHAYQQGHRRIGFVGSYVCANNFRDRFGAYRAEIAMLGLEYRPEYVYEVHGTVGGANEDMHRLLAEKRPLPTVFVCANDLIAMGVMDALVANGYSIPDDISIIGFDDMLVSAHLNPPLTSVGFYTRKIARTAVDTLVERIKRRDDSGESMRCLISTELRVRKSVRQLEPQTEI